MTLKILGEENNLRAILAPDGKSFMFFAQGTQQEFIEKVLLGEDYPVLYANFYEPKTIVDIGAHVGSASRYFKHLFPDAQIYAFEPHPLSYKILEKNCSQWDDIHIFNVGLGDEDEDIRLYEGQYNAMQASTLPSEIENREHFYDINILNAEQVFQDQNIEKIDILKIDTEGVEVPILRAIEHRILSTDIVLLEYHSEEDRKILDGMMGEQKLLYHADVMEPHRGTLGYISTSLLDRLRKEHSIPYYAEPKKHKYSSGK